MRITHDFLVDAQPWGLSAQLFRAVVARRRGLLAAAWGGVNDAWLEDGGEGGGDGDAKRACALGHIMNDPLGSAAGRANVQFKVRRRGVVPVELIECVP